MSYIIIGILIVALFAVIFYFNRNKTTIDPEVLNKAAEGFVRTNMVGLINLLSACYCSLKNTEDVLTEDEIVERLIDYAYITVNELSVVYDIDISCISKLPKDVVKHAIFTIYNEYKYLISNLEQGDSVVADNSGHLDLYVIKANDYKESVDDFLRKADPFVSEDDVNDFDSVNYQ